MDEQFYTITKHGATVRIKTGVTNDGRMIAREVETYWNGGAYADIGPRVTQKSGFTAAGPYDIEHVALDNYAVYTNEPPAGALRGFGISQLVWAYERQADIIARTLGIDPLEFRRRNVLRNGRPHATGTIVSDMEIDAVLDLLEQRMDWHRPFDRGSGAIRRGRGVAIGLKACISPTTSVAMVLLYGDGSCALHCGTVDMGQASDTAMAQIVAEVLGIPTASVRVVHPDTDVTPYDMATLGSRSTFHMGNAVQAAAEDVRAQVLRIAATSLDTELSELECVDAEVVSRRGARMTLREIMLARFAMQAGTIVGVGSFTPSYKKPDLVHRPVARRHAVLDARRRRRRDRGRHRDRTDRRDQAGERGRRRARDQPGVGRPPAHRRRHHAARVHAVRGDGLQRRPGGERQPRRLQDPGLPRSASRHLGRLRRGAAPPRPVRREGRWRDRRLQSVARHCQCALRRARDRRAAICR